jgi:hypothetical protein
VWLSTVPPLQREGNLVAGLHELADPAAARVVQLGEQQDDIRLAPGQLLGVRQVGVQVAFIDVQPKPIGRSQTPWGRLGIGATGGEGGGKAACQGAPQQRATRAVSVMEVPRGLDHGLT